MSSGATNGTNQAFSINSNETDFDIRTSCSNSSKYNYNLTKITRHAHVKLGKRHDSWWHNNCLSEIRISFALSNHDLSSENRNASLLTHDTEDIDDETRNHDVEDQNTSTTKHK